MAKKIENCPHPAGETYKVKVSNKKTLIACIDCAREVWAKEMSPEVLERCKYVISLNIDVDEIYGTG